MKEKIKVSIVKCESNYSASLSDNVPGAVVLTADTLEGIKAKTPDTLRFHIEGMVADGDDVPQWFLEGNYKFEYVITVDCKSLIDILNNIDSVFKNSYPVVFRPVADEDGESVKNIAGLDDDHNFIWQEENLGNLVFIHADLWDNTRIENLFTDYLGNGDFEILEGSFTGETMVK